MAHRDAHRKYSETALEAWFQKLSTDWEPWFSEPALRRGRQIYREGRIREVELAPDHAIVHCRLEEADRTDAYSIIDWDQDRPSFRNSSREGLTGEAVAAAGMYEIEELVADEIPPIPRAPRTPSSLPQPPPGSNGETPHDLSDEIPDTPPEVSPTAPLRLEFHWREGHLVCTPYRTRSDGSQSNAFDPATTANHPENAAVREQVIRLSALARKSGFTFDSAQKRFTLDGFDRFNPFLNGTLKQWQALFTVELGPTVRQIAKGIRNARIVANFEGPSRPDNLRSNQGLGFKWRILVGEEWLSDEETSRLLRSRETTAILRDRGALRLDPEQLRAVEVFQQSQNALGSDQPGLPPYMVFSLFRESGIEIELDASVLSWRDALAAEPARLSDPPRFLRNYQAEGVAWLLHLTASGCGPLLADDMGLGKTVQILAYLHAVPNPDQLPSLIVCPASVAPVWLNEARRFFPGLELRVLNAASPFAPNSGPVIWIASFSQLRRNRPLLDTLLWNSAVIDEAQQIKNPEAKSTRACYAIRARNRIALSGTPVENHQSDIWSIFRFLMPGLLGPRKDFLARLQRKDPSVSNEALRTQLAPFILRRTKKKVARELPDKVENLTICPLSETQRRAYRELCERAVTEFGDDVSRIAPDQQIHFFALLTRLRQACCDAALLPPEIPGGGNPASPSGKLQALLEKLEEILQDDRRVVIFSQFVPFLERIGNAIAERFPEVQRIELTGKTRDRATPVESFQKSRGRAVMLVSLKAGGAGITLHAADYVFLMDPWWNPAVENQAIDRVHRIGQRRTVMVYRMVTEGTIEASIQKLKEEKAGLFDEVVGALESGRIHYQEHLETLRSLIEGTLPAVA